MSKFSSAPKRSYLASSSHDFIWFLLLRLSSAFSNVWAAFTCKQLANWLSHRFDIKHVEEFAELPQPSNDITNTGIKFLFSLEQVKRIFRIQKSAAHSTTTRRPWGASWCCGVLGGKMRKICWQRRQNTHKQVMNRKSVARGLLKTRKDSFGNNLKSICGTSMRVWMRGMPWV